MGDAQPTGLVSLSLFPHLTAYRQRKTLCQVPDAADPSDRFNLYHRLCFFRTFDLLS